MVYVSQEYDSAGRIDKVKDSIVPDAKAIDGIILAFQFFRIGTHEWRFQNLRIDDFADSLLQARILKLFKRFAVSGGFREPEISGQTRNGLSSHLPEHS